MEAGLTWAIVNPFGSCTLDTELSRWNLQVVILGSKGFISLF